MKGQAVAARIFDLLADNPGGLTIDQMADALHVSHRQIGHGIRALRIVLGDTDTISLVADPDHGHKEPWTYRLVGTLDEVIPWTGFSIKHIEARITTTAAVVAPMTAGDARTTETRKARLIHRSLSRLSEDLADIDIA